jgi:TPP-dependent trihydroxycyclohexane-1,2-dione (THcHDO) dehydratase
MQAMSALALVRRLAQRVRDADLIIAIGPRLGEMTTGGYTLLQAPKARIKSWCTSTPAPKSSTGCTKPIWPSMRP